MTPARPVAAGTAVAAVAATLLLSAAVPRAQSGRPMMLDDLLSAVRIADPQLSPDSRTVVYVRTTTDLPSGRRNADLWSVPADGGTAKLLIGGDKAENTPRWSADGRRLAVHLDPGRRGAGVRRGRRWHRHQEDHRSRDGCAAAVDRVAGRDQDRVRLRRLPRVCGRGLQQAPERGNREEPGQGPPAHASPVAALGRMARERASPCDGGRRRVQAGRRRHTRRLRFAAGPAGGRGDRVLTGRP